MNAVIPLVVDEDTDADGREESVHTSDSNATPRTPTDWTIPLPLTAPRFFEHELYEDGVCVCEWCTQKMVRWSWLHYNNLDWVPGKLLREPEPLNFAYCCSKPMRRAYVDWVKAEKAKHWERMVALAIAIATYATVRPV